MRRGLLFLILGGLCSMSWAALDAPKGPPARGPVRKESSRVMASDQNMENRVHRAGAMWMNITNYGFYGNDNVGQTDALTDPEYPGVYAPQLEFPGGSRREYLFMGAIWVGAMIQQPGTNIGIPRVSVGVDGWVNPANGLRGEFYPGIKPGNGITERSTILNKYNRLGDYVTDTVNAVSQQDFVCTYTDTLTEGFWVPTDEIDGPHYPLGIKVTQQSYAWSYNYAQNFIIMDYQFENIAANYLKNVYVGMYVDADVGLVDENDRHVDDITGFQRFYYYNHSDGTPDSLVINCAWIADNDGRPHDVHYGTDFTVPDILGCRVLRAPNPRLKTSYNWWVSNGNKDLDFGPSWVGVTPNGDWPYNFSTPMGDKNKYSILSNREFDYDQVYVGTESTLPPQQDLDHANVTHAWKTLSGTKATNAANIAKGYDTRFLLSWGPLGVYDGNDPTGERRYRLNPGEKFSMTLGLVMGVGFHDPNTGGQIGTVIDPRLFNFATLQRAAAQAARVYDNPMKDTHTREFPNGDGWYGEDTGTDGLFAAAPHDSVVIEGIFHGIYPGPDPDGTENNGRIDSLAQNDPNHVEFIGCTEDTHPWYPSRIDYMRGNGVLDGGDGDPDFLGPPPPPAPICSVYTTSTSVRIRWHQKPSEDPLYQNPFSGLQDFEGYRLYVSNSGLENDFSFVKQWDKVDYAYYFANDSLADVPFSADSARHAAASKPYNGLNAFLRPVGSNTGFTEILDSIRINDSTWDKYYEYEIKNAAPIFARYYAVTAYSFGDPKGGTESLETSKVATMVHTAPSGDPAKPVGVAPNPYRIDQDYTKPHSGGLQWENQDDGTVAFYPQQDRRIWFYNLPKQALIRIFTVAGDLVVMIPHNIEGDKHECLAFDYAACWNLQNRNEQLVSSGLYLFSVEDKTPGGSSKVQTGKLVIIR